MSTRVLAPGYSLVNWGGDLTRLLPRALLPRLRRGRLRRWPGCCCSIVGLVARAAPAPRDIRWGLGGIVAFGVLAALYFRPREYGWYFHFKALAFVAPLGVTRRRRRPGAAEVGRGSARGADLPRRRDAQRRRAGDRHDVRPAAQEHARAQARRRALPPDASVRLDMPADGRQLWAGIILSGQPLCSQRPVLETSYPHVPVSRKADYVLVDDDWRKPFDAVGPPRHDARPLRAVPPARRTCPGRDGARARWC